MSILFNSILIVFLTVSFQQLPYGRCIDFVTPLIVAVGITSTKKRAALWVVFMSILWIPLTRFSFLLILVIWLALILIINFLSTKIRWNFVTAGLVIAPITSLVWNFLLLTSTWSFQFVPTLNNQIYFSFFLRSVSSSILTILFWNLLVGKFRLHHPLSHNEKINNSIFIKS